MEGESNGTIGDKSKVNYTHSPNSDGLEGVHIGQIKHEDEAHGSPVVGGGDGAIPLLSRCIPDLKLDAFVISAKVKSQHVIVLYSRTYCRMALVLPLSVPSTSSSLFSLHPLKKL